ncbi:MAG: ribosome maturation factor RimM [Cyclobacteriaceae bacterium]|nr:ribosome maturation factor RimM [Cyclobacteriaceae bacterium]
MTPEDCFELGYIVRSHGLKGAMHVHLDVDDPAKYNKMESVFALIEGNLVPFLVKSLQIAGVKGIIEFEGISSAEDALGLKSCPLYLPLKLLPKLKEGQFYYHQVIGYTVVDKVKGPLGTITDIYSSGAQDIISMKYQDKEVLVPVSDEIVLHADHGKNEVYVQLPDGLLEIYL